MIPGEKRSPADRAIAGATTGPGRRAGRRRRPDDVPGRWGSAPALPALRRGAERRGRRGTRRPTACCLDPTVPPFVALPFRHRTALALQLLEGGTPDQLRLVRPGRRRRAGLPHRRAPAHGGRRAVAGIRASPGSTSRCPTPTACGASRSSPTGGSLRPVASAHHSIREPRMSAVETTDVVVIGTGFGGAIPAYNLAAGGARVVMLERGPEAGDRGVRPRPADRHLHPLRRPDQRRRACQVVAGNCVGGSSVVYFAAVAARAVVRLRRAAARPARTGCGRAALTRSTLDPWYDRVEETTAGRPADLGRRAVRRWACGRRRAATPGTPATRCPLAVDLPTVHQLQLDAVRLPVRREALDAAQLPAGRPRPRRRRSGRCTRCSRSARRPPRATATGSTTACSTPTTTGCRTGGGAIEAKIVVVAAGAMGTPVILQRSAAALGGVPDAVGRYFSPNGDRVSMALLDEEKLRVGARPPARAGDGVRGLPHRQADRLHVVRLPRRGAAGVRALRTAADLLPARSRTSFPRTAPRRSRSGSASTRRSSPKRWRSWLTLLALTEDDNEGVFGAPPPTGNFVRAAPTAVITTLQYHANAYTRRGWTGSDRAIRAIIEKDGVGKHLSWVGGQPTLTAHPLASCRMGDDPATSALTADHELRGSPGLFVTDGSAVPDVAHRQPVADHRGAGRARLAAGDRGACSTSSASGWGLRPLHPSVPEVESAAATSRSDQCSDRPLGVASDVVTVHKALVRHDVLLSRPA